MRVPREATKAADRLSLAEIFHRSFREENRTLAAGGAHAPPGSRERAAGEARLILKDGESFAAK